MRVIIAGGTGLIGRALTESLVKDGHDVIVLSRSPEQFQKRTVKGARLVQWDGASAEGWAELADGADALVNYAGENIGSQRWSNVRRHQIIQSRAKAGAAMMDAIARATTKPKLLVQASAVGLYGPRGDEIVTEDTTPGKDFLARVVWEWESSTAAAVRMGVRRVVLRTGVAFSTKGGVFPRYLLPFRMVVAGGPLGSGRQYVPWIHLEDHVRATRF